MGFNGIYPLVICYVAMERSTIFNGILSTISITIFNSYVKLPEGIPKKRMKGLPFSWVPCEIEWVTHIYIYLYMIFLLIYRKLFTDAHQIIPLCPYKHVDK